MKLYSLYNFETHIQHVDLAADEIISMMFKMKDVTVVDQSNIVLINLRDGIALVSTFDKEILSALNRYRMLKEISWWDKFVWKWYFWFRSLFKVELST